MASRTKNVRKKAVELTVQWKDLVKGKLVAASEKKRSKSKKRDSDEDEAGETLIDRCRVSHAWHCSEASPWLPVFYLPVCTSSSAETGSNRKGAGQEREFTEQVRRSKAESCALAPRGVLHVVLVAAALLLLTRRVDCYSLPPAPHHFFAAAGAGPAGSSAASPSKSPASGKLARPR